MEYWNEATDQGKDMERRKRKALVCATLLQTLETLTELLERVQTPEARKRLERQKKRLYARLRNEND
ncbi:hypothetical protein PSEWESI4_00302 [Pseudomonas carbonaria]|uniref:Uncharacterized protein n=2 Tax=Zestomonas carbonaria TaxID=2762745 RepID=A0A7U7EJ73_9GAMM|nr:hypothetical protein PSEWESI4_00302 [Pseudomonas carbonaria]